MEDEEYYQIENSCSNCAYWFENDTPMDGYGCCHRYPPTIISDDISFNKAREPVLVFYPWTLVDDVCGEYKGRSEQREDRALSGTKEMPVRDEDSEFVSYDTYREVRQRMFAYMKRLQNCRCLLLAGSDDQHQCVRETCVYRKNGSYCGTVCDLDSYATEL